MLPVIGAIANAIEDAVGVRVRELPITPEKILAGLSEKAMAEKAMAEKAMAAKAGTKEDR